MTLKFGCKIPFLENAFVSMLMRKGQVGRKRHSKNLTLVRFMGAGGLGERIKYLNLLVHWRWTERHETDSAALFRLNPLKQQS